VSLGPDFSGKVQQPGVATDFDYEHFLDFNHDLDFALFDTTPSISGNSVAPLPGASPLSADVVLGTPHSDFQESFGASFFDLQPGQSATHVSDGPGLAAESEFQILSME
jgi:hypothetical protein